MTPMLPSPDAAAAPRWGVQRQVRAGLLAILLLAGGMGGWAVTAELAGAVIAPGRLRVEAQRQVVQHPDGGVVGEILVREGDHVEAGATLIRLDDTTLRSELAVLESQLFEIMARRGRLEAEQTDAAEIAFDPELASAAAVRPDVAALIEGQRRLFRARAETMEGERSLLAERQIQIAQQITGTEAQLDALRRQHAFIDEELEGQRKLFAQGLAQANRVLSLEREAARLKGQEGELISRVAQLTAQISEIGIERLKLGTLRREEAITQLRDLGFRELELKERRIALRERLDRLDIRAPRAGVVYELAVFAIKAVIRPAEPVLYVVPTDESLVIDIEIDPIHIDEVAPGMQAVVRFPAFSSRTTPELNGIVARISPDAHLDEQSGRSFYRGEAVLAEGERERLADRELLAGMPVEVFVQTGARTPMAYLMKPLTDYFNRAFRET
ncbi:HlyD family type I secretion periplasmic adaptor subunit [Limibaculum sp. FT325]|uniref:HlyD family type I secretion periplasmic adaptor subunit n=1 Tax=Thermohalobaculum sediminis TaxID=2939436 RepID=UPI0020C01CF4|nr:HlyD family type I secretion periplasmic adaptor subunit [Limibaculum sediminis]MCL5777924.1 HlyD family type I secretion periplasmic adaptor subunit [Limibaculum sediminis]